MVQTLCPFELIVVVKDFHFVKISCRYLSDKASYSNLEIVCLEAPLSLKSIDGTKSYPVELIMVIKVFDFVKISWRHFLGKVGGLKIDWKQFSRIINFLSK